MSYMDIGDCKLLVRLSCSPLSASMSGHGYPFLELNRKDLLKAEQGYSTWPNLIVPLAALSVSFSSLQAVWTCALQLVLWKRKQNEATNQ